MVVLTGLCNAPTGVSRVYTVTGGRGTVVIRSTTRSLNTACGKERAKAFNGCGMVSFGNGGVVANSSNKVLLASSFSSTGGTHG